MIQLLPPRDIENRQKRAPVGKVGLVLFAVALGVAVAVASVTTLERVNTHKVSSDAMPGTTGLARPHPQLDRAPGETILKDR
jgi:hypothetical protein